MPERTEHAPGTPSWVDIGTDVEAATPFYTGLFGWEAESAGPADETGGYGYFLKNGKMVAGIGPQQNPGPPFWTTYITVADADETAAKVKEAGGQVVMDPMDVMAVGRMAVFSDPTGAFFSIWQPGEHIGAQVVNEPGSLSWNELQSRDVATAKDFYAAVFGWTYLDHEMGPMTYTEIQRDGDTVAGILPMPPMVPDEVPPYWLVYFAVDDCDAALARAQELGAQVLVPPMDVPAGRFSVLTDPQGATFAVIKLAA